jgi:hypothetical protein
VPQLNTSRSSHTHDDRYDHVYTFDLKGTLREDPGAAYLRLTATWYFFDDGTEESHHEERPICDWEVDWVQDGKKTCELKAGEVAIYKEPFEFPPFSLGPNSSLSIRATLWSGDSQRVIDFESTVFVDRDDSGEEHSLKG